MSLHAPRDGLVMGLAIALAVTSADSQAGAIAGGLVALGGLPVRVTARTSEDVGSVFAYVSVP